MMLFNTFALRSLPVIVALCLPATAMAAQCEKTPGVNLNAVSSEDVDNDMVRMHWQVQVQAGSASEAMTAINTVIEKSISSLSKNKDISKLRNNLQTFPQYSQDQRIQTWQGVGSLSFEMPVQAMKQQKSLNVAEGLTLSNLEYFPGDSLVERSRVKLLQTAIQEFQAKAATAAKGFGKSGYSLGEISINDENYNNPGQPRMFASAEMARGKSMDVAQAAGSSKLSVSINGRVCLNP